MQQEVNRPSPIQLPKVPLLPGHENYVPHRRSTFITDPESLTALSSELKPTVSTPVATPSADLNSVSPMIRFETANEMWNQKKELDGVPVFAMKSITMMQKDLEYFMSQTNGDPTAIASFKKLQAMLRMVSDKLDEYISIARGIKTTSPDNTQTTLDQAPVVDETMALIEALQNKLEVKDEMITELGKKLDAMTKQTSELSVQVHQLTKERNVAKQSNDELIRMITEKKENEEKLQLQVQKAEQERQRFDDHIERVFFNETQILDDAIDQFRKLVANQEAMKEHADALGFSESQIPPMRQSQYQDSSFFNPGSIKVQRTAPENLTIQENQDEAIRDVSSDRVSTIKQHDSLDMVDKLAKLKSFQPPSALGVGLKASMNNTLHQNETQRARTSMDGIKHGRPSHITATNFHSQLIHHLAAKVPYVYDKPPTELGTQTKQPVAVKNPNEALAIMRARLSETAMSLYECINALAEERRQTRRWKAQYDYVASKVVELEATKESDCNQNRKFLENRQGLVNALLPIARPKAAEQNKWVETQQNPPDVEFSQEKPQTAPEALQKEESQEKGLPSITQTPSERVRIYIPKTSTGYIASKQIVPQVNWWTNLPKSAVDKRRIFTTAKHVPFTEAKKYLVNKFK